MNRKRLVCWLLFGSLALAGAHFLVDMRLGVPSSAVYRSAIAPVAAQATAFSVVQSNSVVTCAVRTDTGWRLSSPCVAEASEQAVLRLTDALAFASVKESLTDAELLRLGRTRADFALDAPRLRVTVSGGGTPTTVAFGDDTPAHDGVYAVVDGVSCVYIVPTNVFAAVNLSVADLRQRRVFQFLPDDIVALDLREGNRYSRLVHTTTGWSMSEPKVSAASTERIVRYLDLLSRATVRDFIWPAESTNETEVASVSLLSGYGLDAETALSVSLTGADGRIHSVSFGREAGSGAAYALYHGGRAIVTLPDTLRAATGDGFTSFVDLRLFPVRENAITSISLTEGGVECLLSKSETGAWRLDAPVVAPADAENVRLLVGRILALTSENADPAGIAVSVGGVEGSRTVSRSALLGAMTLPSLRAKEMLRIPVDSVARVTVMDDGTRTMSFVRDTVSRTWRAEGNVGSGSPDAAALDRLVAALDPLAASAIAHLDVTVDTLGRVGLDRPKRLIAIDCSAKGSVRRNVLLGDVTEGGRFAMLGASDAIFVVSSETLARLMAPLVH